MSSQQGYISVSGDVIPSNLNNGSLHMCTHSFLLVIVLYVKYI